MKRVVVTGMAGITSLGSDWQTIAGNFAGQPQRHPPHGRVGSLQRTEHPPGRPDR